MEDWIFFTRSGNETTMVTRGAILSSSKWVAFSCVSGGNTWLEVADFMAIRGLGSLEGDCLACIGLEIGGNARLPLTTDGCAATI
jgi:hypothetical protein